MGSSEVIQLNTEHKIFLQLNHCIVANNNIIKSGKRCIPPTLFSKPNCVWMIFECLWIYRERPYFIDILLIILLSNFSFLYLKICLSWGWHNLNNDNVWLWTVDCRLSDLMTYLMCLAIMKMNGFCVDG